MTPNQQLICGGLIVGQKFIECLQIKNILLLENLFDMVNRRDSVVSCRC